jgi:ferredoxin-NADP reductase
MELRLEALDEAPVPDFLAGQHVTVALENSAVEARAYSLTGPATQVGRRGYSIAVRHARYLDNSGGRVSGWMSGHIHRQLREGEVLYLKAPSGSFIMPMQSRRPVVLFAGGIGVTPFISYLETLANAKDTPEVWLFSANRSRKSHPFVDRVEALSGRIPRLKRRHFYRSDAESSIAEHRLTAAAVEDHVLARRPVFYLCGPDSMMDHLTNQLIARGVPAFDIFREAFKSPLKPSGDPSLKFRVTFARSGQVREWSASDGSLLSFAETSGVTLPSGCRVGQCESCTVRLLAGAVVHLDGSHSQEPDTCLACQAIPCSDLVVDA